MKLIYHYLKDYIQDHFNRKLYLSTVVFTFLIVFLNFYFDLEDSVVDAYYGSNLRILWFFFFQAIPYYIVCLFVWAFTDTKSFIRQKGFWIVSIIGFLILALHRGGYFALMIVPKLSPSPLTYAYIYKFFNKWLPLLTVVFPLFLIHRLYLRKEFSHFYGIRRKGVHLKPYFILLALMVPLIIIASFQPDFLREYPNYRTARGDAFSAYMGINETLLILGYEFSYAFGFFIVELFFRGFLIYAMLKYLGKEVVLPMTVTYCVLHFGKPLGEAISSVFGGYILGILAYRTQNIYGGIVVHIGIALLMDIFAFMQM